MLANKDIAYLKGLCRRHGIAALILFGSEARGRANPLSDIDLAYLPSRRMSQAAETGLFLEISKRLKRDDIDLIDISGAGLLLRYSALATGTVIVCSDGRALYDFAVRTRREYLDTAHIRGVFAHYLVKRLKAGQFGAAR